jgi:hypothetical protein
MVYIHTSLAIVSYGIQLDVMELWHRSEHSFSNMRDSTSRKS